MKKVERGLQTLNECTALRWFLYTLRHCEPRVLEELAEGGVSRFNQGTSYTKEETTAFRAWYSSWVRRYWLPRTPMMLEETKATLIHGYLAPPCLRWHFEPAPYPSDTEKLLAKYSRSNLPPPLEPCHLELLPCPISGTNSEFQRWKNSARKRLEDLIRGIEERRAEMRRLKLFQPEDVWLLLPLSGEYVRRSPKTPVWLIARDLVYLAMKQAGAKYREIPARFAPNLRGGYVPPEYLDPQKAPDPEKGLPPAVRRVAAHIGLQGRIRPNKAGPTSVRLEVEQNQLFA